jgi:hypothetical protein
MQEYQPSLAAVALSFHSQKLPEMPFRIMKIPAVPLCHFQNGGEIQRMVFMRQAPAKMDQLHKMIRKIAREDTFFRHDRSDVRIAAGIPHRKRINDVVRDIHHTFQGHMQRPFRCANDHIAPLIFLDITTPLQHVVIPAHDLQTRMDPFAVQKQSGTLLILPSGNVAFILLSGKTDRKRKELPCLCRINNFMGPIPAAKEET